MKHRELKDGGRDRVGKQGLYQVRKDRERTFCMMTVIL